MLTCVLEDTRTHVKDLLQKDLRAHYRNIHVKTRAFNFLKFNFFKLVLNVFQCKVAIFGFLNMSLRHKLTLIKIIMT